MVLWPKKSSNCVVSNMILFWYVPSVLPKLWKPKTAGLYFFKNSPFGGWFSSQHCRKFRQNKRSLHIFSDVSWRANEHDNIPHSPLWDFWNTANAQFSICNIQVNMLVHWDLQKKSCFLCFGCYNYSPLSILSQSQHITKID